MGLYRKRRPSVFLSKGASTQGKSGSGTATRGQALPAIILPRFLWPPHPFTVWPPTPELQDTWELLLRSSLSICFRSHYLCHTEHPCQLLQTWKPQQDPWGVGIFLHLASAVVWLWLYPPSPHSFTLSSIVPKSRASLQTP